MAEISTNQLSSINIPEKDFQKKHWGTFPYAEFKHGIWMQKSKKSKKNFDSKSPPHFVILQWLLDFVCNWINQSIDRSIN